MFFSEDGVMIVSVDKLYSKDFNAQTVHDALLMAADDTRPSVWGWHIHEGADNGPYGDIPGDYVVTCWWRMLNNRNMPLDQYYWQAQELPKLHAAGKKIILRIEDPRHYAKWGGVPFDANRLGEFNAWAKQIIQFARPYIYAVQFWNEIAELGGNEYFLVGWNGQRIDPWYATITQMWSYKMVKTIAPELKVLMPALGNPHKHSWADQLLSAGMAEWTDGWNLHIYNSYSESYYSDRYTKWAMPVYVTECNASSGASWPMISSIKAQCNESFGSVLKAFCIFNWQGVGELLKFTSRQFADYVRANK